MTSAPPGDLVARLRAAGCVFAEDEAAVLVEWAQTPGDLEWACDRRESGDPLEHIVGFVDLGDTRLSVGPGVFVPRQRSLLLADATVRAVREATTRVSSPIVLEAFCGVSPIARVVQLAVGAATIHAIDHDDVALGYARINLGREAGVHRGDVLDGLPPGLHGRIDVIAAVPPYVPGTDIRLLPREATDHEPAAALFGGADGTSAITVLIADAPAWLSDGGVLLMEMNVIQAQQVRDAVDVPGRPSPWQHIVVHTGDDDQTAVLMLTRADGKVTGQVV